MVSVDTCLTLSFFLIHHVQLIFIILTTPAVQAAHPIVIVNNNHNNHGGPFVGSSNVTSDSLTVEADSPMIFDQVSPTGEFTTGGTVPFVPSSPNGPNTGSIVSLDDTIGDISSNFNANGSSNDAFSLFFSNDPPAIMGSNGASYDTNSSSTSSGMPNVYSNGEVNQNINISRASTVNLLNSPVLSNFAPSPPPSASPFPSPTPTPLPRSPSSSPSNTNSNKTDLHHSSSESKLRWVDYRSRPALPPRVPTVPGIPSGFRNPITTMSPAILGHANPNLAHNFGPSSSNPVGFAGAIPPAIPSFPASNVNQDRRRPMINMTRVERKSL